MIYTMTAHETTYNNVRFRSRLEARWAAFFDLLEWKWLYEPLELNGWIPDFQLRDLWPDEEGRLFGHSSACYIHTPNPFVEIKPSDDEADFDKEKILKALSEGGLCLLLGYSPFFDMCEIGKEFWDTFTFYGDDENHKLWNEAGNIVQWKPRR